MPNGECQGCGAVQWNARTNGEPSKISKAERMRRRAQAARVGLGFSRGEAPSKRR